ncbi:MAG: holo-[acyl-carrier-protein] synthase [Planctomycetes bacterium]|nr:holo-[acyl-carrier-protein] synthase [Planctomycetota bacterium]
MHIVGVGNDIIECLRIAQLIERHGEAFLQRVFAPGEIQYCSGRSAATQHFAAHWAGKQAALKSLGASWRRGMSWHDVEILVDAERPILVPHGIIRELVDRASVSDVMLSLSHCRTHAVATAIAVSHARTG